MERLPSPGTSRQVQGGLQSASSKESLALASPGQDTEQRHGNRAGGAKYEKQNSPGLLSVNYESGTPLSFLYRLSGLILAEA